MNHLIPTRFPEVGKTISLPSVRSLGRVRTLARLACTAAVLGWAGRLPAQDLPTPAAPGLPAQPVLELLPQEVGPATMIGNENAAPEMSAAEPAAVEAAETADAVLEAPNPGPPASRWKVLPHIDLQVMWDDNIFIQANNEISDFLFRATPGLTLGYLDDEARLERFLDRQQRASRAVQFDGNFFLLDYTPSYVVFLENDAENSFDQEARFEARWQLQKLSLSAQAAFLSRNETNIDIGRRLRHTAYNVGLSARYQFTERTSADLGGFYLSDEFEDAPGNVELRSEAYVNYELTPRVQVSLGLAVGQVEVEQAPSQTFERILARGSYSITDKVSVRAQGGVEFRQFDGGRDQINPIFELDLLYVPAELTTVGVGFYRRVIPSFSLPEDSVETMGVTVNFSRDLQAGLRLLAAAGYQKNQFSSTGATEERTDEFFFGRIGVLYNFANWGSAGLNYEYRNNDSTRSISGFTNNQITLDLSLTF